MTGWLLLVGGIAVACYAALIAALLIAGRRVAARALAGFIPDCIVLFRRVLGDSGVPRRRKLAVVGLIAYLSMPIDLIPDFVPIAGQLDDAVLVALVLRYLLRGDGPQLLERHWPGPEESLRLVMRLSYGRTDPRVALSRTGSADELR